MSEIQHNIFEGNGTCIKTNLLLLGVRVCYVSIFFLKTYVFSFKTVPKPRTSRYPLGTLP